MIYLTICPLVAAFIGALIGWVLKGDCQKEIIINNNDWNEKLKKNDNQWNYEINNLKKDYNRNISNLNQKLLFNQSILEKHESQLKKEKANWRKIQNSWEAKKERLISNNDNNLIYLNKELTIIRKKIQNLKLEGEKILNINMEYIYQIKNLTKKHDTYIFNSKKSFYKQLNQKDIELKKAKDEIKKLKLKKM